MNVNQAYNIWAEQYDTNENKTRDLEASALRTVLDNLHFDSCLELGCGTGKNTEWILTKANKILAVDFSDEMLAKANSKIQSNKVEFIQADINNEWNFINKKQFGLVIFSLVLEHLQNLDNVFAKLKNVVKQGGYVYIGELHPYKQYNGTKARFETENGIQIVTCFNHNISDFTTTAKKYGFEIIEVLEFFDDNNRANIPRILTLLFSNTTK
ncbi:MAG: class I SAM-dependent methyltransferase [Chitinophagaceae bacterium]|nr:class I SAM-dependent methyltransferase [Chitinophagaceae bacterium]